MLKADKQAARKARHEAWMVGQPARARARAAADKLPRRIRGPGCDYVWCGDVPPWDPSLGEFRDFTPEERAAGLVCRPVSMDDFEGF